MPFFSVVIPSFNASEKIKPTLDSLLAQKYTDFEVVIVDDCSDDFDILNKYAIQQNLLGFPSKYLQHYNSH